MKFPPSLQTGAAVSQRRIFKAVLLMELCKYISGGFFVSGVLFLIMRSNGAVTLQALGSAAGWVLLCALLLGVCRSFYLTPSREKIAVYLCSLIPEGGVLLSAAECGKEVPDIPSVPQVPALKCEKLLPGVLILPAGLLFAAGALFAPLFTEDVSNIRRTLDLKDETEKFSQGVELLRRMNPEKEEKILALQKEFEETVSQAKAASPGRSYELLNELTKRLNAEVAQSARETENFLRHAAALQYGAEELDRSGKAAEQMENFSKLLKAMAQTNPQIAEALKKGNFDPSKLSPDELKKLARAMGMEKEKAALALQDMEKFLEQRDSSSQKELKEAETELEEFIRENVPGCDDLIESLTNREENCGNAEGGGSGPETGAPGSGSPARGKGDAPLEYSNFTPDYGAQRKDKKVRSHLPGERHNSTRLVSFAVDTEQKEEKSTLRPGQLQTQSRHAGFQESTLHPAHRKAVKRYFEKERKNP